MRRFLIAVAILIFLGVAGVAGLYYYIEQTALAPADPQQIDLIEVEVPKGSSIDRIGGLLFDRGIITSVWVWRAYVRLHPTVPAKAGKHRLSAAMPIPSILTAIGGQPLSEDVPLTLVEGWRIGDVDLFLAAQGAIKAGEYLAAANEPSRFKIPFSFSAPNLEGYLYPETYMVRPGPLDVNALIQRQIDSFHKKFSEPRSAEISASGRSLHELVTMASLLEREEPSPAVRKKVAGVLYKRLDGGVPLGVDATSRYTLAEWNDRKAFLKQLRDPNDPYNTRLKKGLPPGPIGAPAIESLEAALKPEPSSAWYYLHDKDKNIHFADDAAGHEANRKKYGVY